MFKKKSYQFTLHLTIFCMSFCTAWLVLATFNFGYSVWFEALGIYDFIQEMGPLNRYKPHFSALSPAEYKALFWNINYGIHFAPEELSKITYSYTLDQKETITTALLRAPEVTHLQDVATLIRIGGGIFASAIGMLLYFYFKHSNQEKRQINPLKAIAPTWIFLISTTVIIFLTKPVQFFYWLHELIFPKKNEWFFYYQDSLMTTLMKAPDLFGPISIALLIACILAHGMLATFFLRRCSIP